MDLKAHDPAVFYSGKKLEFDAVIPRIGASITFYRTAVVRQFEMFDVYSLNKTVAISRSRDKLRSLQLLSRKGIGIRSLSPRRPRDAAHNRRCTGRAQTS